MTSYSIIKRPEFENDSMLISLKDVQFRKDHLLYDDYVKTKIKIFENPNKITYRKDEPLYDKLIKLKNEHKYLQGCFNAAAEMFFLPASNYTYAVQLRNGNAWQDAIKTMLKEDACCRRAVLTMASSLDAYFFATMNSPVPPEEIVDISCTTTIQYVPQFNKAVITLRASDALNELYADLILLYLFFVKPIFEKPVTLEVYAATTQNIFALESTLKKVILL